VLGVVLVEQPLEKQVVDAGRTQALPRHETVLRPPRFPLGLPMMMEKNLVRGDQLP